jgi:hypothetical protein
MNFNLKIWWRREFKIKIFINYFIDNFMIHGSNFNLFNFMIIKMIGVCYELNLEGLRNFNLEMWRRRGFKTKIFISDFVICSKSYF